jgi:parallel beta-helix repeat protein
MVITEDTRLAPGVYVLPNGIRIGADKVMLDGTGVHIVSPEKKGVGIHIQGKHAVHISGISISGFYHGIRIDDSEEIHLQGITVRDTHEIEGIDTFLYLWHPIEEVYGGAVLLNSVDNGVIRNCDLQHQMVGVLMYDCTNTVVENNNASFNSGWGVYLNNSHDNTIQRNQLDFCNRLFRRPEDGSIRVEADAAAIVLVQSSSRNRILQNSCLCGGDGIFIAGMVYKTGARTSCNDNLIEGNDCRLSPNNAIEAVFCRGNVFRNNDCSRSNYGFWMGYSWDSVVENNHIEFSRWAGIAIEHGHNITIRNNRILRNTEGVRLFTQGGEVLQYWQGWEVAYDFLLENNQFESNNIGFNGYTDKKVRNQLGYGYTLTGNTFRDNRIGARFEWVENCSVTGNTFAANVESALVLRAAQNIATDDNRFEGNAAEIRSES